MLKKQLLCLLLLLSGFHLKAQTLSEVDSIVAKYPKRFSSAERLAERVQADFTSEYAKARAIFTWIALNVKYDVKALSKPRKSKPIKYKTEEELQRKLKLLAEKKVRRTLRRKKGLCGDYSQLYNRVAELAGLKCEINRGMAKIKKYDVGRKRVTIDHAWNAVLIDGTWRLIDVTWGAGYVDNERKKFIKKFKPIYFDTPQDFFFAKHYPEKGIWHEQSIDKETFLKGPLVYYDLAQGEYEIIAPESGVIEIKKGEKVTFKIANLPATEKVHYSLRRNDETRLVTDKVLKDNILEFEITIDKTIGKYLTLYIGNTSVATFKIIQQ